jgi:hypothetical protein
MLFEGSNQTAEKCKALAAAGKINNSRDCRYCALIFPLTAFSKILTHQHTSVNSSPAILAYNPCQVAHQQFNRLFAD